MKPLMKMQFRTLKWFLIGALAVGGLSLFLLSFVLSSDLQDIFNAGLHRFSPLYALPSGTYTMLWGLCILSVLMAAVQQIDALNPRNAQLLGAMPLTRETCLWAQLMGALSVLALASMLYALGGSAIFLRHRAMIELFARISRTPDVLLAQNTPLLPLTLALRVLMLSGSAYLATATLLGLFGHAGFGVGFLGALALYAYTLRHFAGTIFDDVSYLLGVEIAEPYTAAMTLFGPSVIGSQSIHPGIPWPIMPWENLGWFLTIHAALWAAALLALRAQRRHLAIEKLGSPVLYAATRWALVLYPVMWMLLFPLTNLLEYDVILHRNVLNRHLGALCLPALLALVLGWGLLIARPRRKLRRSMAASLVLALLLVPCAAHAQAQPRVVVASYDASRIAYDQAHAERVANLCKRLKALADAKLPTPLREGGFDDTEVEWAYRDGYDEPSLVIELDFANLGKELSSYGAYAPAASAFADDLLWFTLDKHVTEAELGDALREAGYPKLAEGCRNQTDALLHENGLWLRMQSGDNYVNGRHVSRTTNVSLYADTPFALKGAEAVDAAILAGASMRRTEAYDNGQYQTLRYEAMLEKRPSWYGVPKAVVILREGVPVQMMFRYPLDYPDALAQIKPVIEDAERATGLTGVWSEHRDSLFSKLVRVEVAFE